MKKLSKEQIRRMEDVNSFLTFVTEVDSERYNPLFGHRGNDGRIFESFFFSDESFVLGFVDPFNGNAIDMLNSPLDIHEKSSEGGNAQEVIKQLAVFILEAKRGHLNDYYHTWAWEYPKIQLVRDKAFSIGFIRSNIYPYEIA